MLQMAPPSRRPRPELLGSRAGHAGQRPHPQLRATRPCPELLVARLLYLAGRPHDADAALAALPPSAQGTPEALSLTVHVKHALGALTEALDALERRAAGPGRLGHDPGPSAPAPAAGLPGPALSLPELLVAACKRFLPLELLIPLVPADEAPASLRQAIVALRDTAQALEDTASAELWSEQLALLSALEDRGPESEAEWRQLMTTPGARPLHAKYFASLRALAGDDEGAVALYAAALAQEPSVDPEVLDALLSSAAPAAPHLVARILREPERRQAALQVLQTRARREPSQPAPWRLMARFFAATGDDAAAARFETKAARLEAHRRDSDIGKVKSAAAYHLAGTTHGFVHDIWVSRTAAAQGGLTILGNVAPDMHQDIQNAFEAARRFVQENFPHLAEAADGYRYTLKVSKDDRTSDGDSAGAAVAVAFISRFLDLPVPQDVAITGRVVVDSAARLRIAGVGAVDAKAMGVHHRRLTRLYAPAENAADMDGAAGAYKSKVAFVSDVSELLGQLFGESVWDL